MYLTSLTNEQLEKIFKLRPHWLAKNYPKWMAIHHEDWMRKNTPEYYRTGYLGSPGTTEVPFYILRMIGLRTW